MHQLKKDTKACWNLTYCGLNHSRLCLLGCTSVKLCLPVLGDLKTSRDRLRSAYELRLGIKLYSKARAFCTTSYSTTSYNMLSRCGK
jgi:hypothetical protein